MKLAADKKIAAYRKAGWWGDDTYYDLFQAGVKARGDALAIVDPIDRPDFLGDAGRRVSWTELSADVERLAAALIGDGLKADDIIVMQMPNVVEAIALYLACAKIGVIVSPVPVQYSGFELRHVIEAVKPRAIVAASRFKERALAQGLRKLAPANVKVYAVGPDARADGIEDLAAIMKDARLKSGPMGLFGETAPQTGKADDCFTIAWTSGTTGMPKGVPRSHNHWISIIPGSGDGMELQAGEILLNPFPLTNTASIAGMLGNWLLTRGVLVLHHPFDLQLFLRQIVEEKVTATIAPPAVLTMLLKHPEMLDSVDLSSLRVVGSGSAPLSEFMVAGWKERGVEIVNIFGSNEGVALVTGPREAPDPALRATRFPRFGFEGADFSNPMHACVKTKLVCVETGEVIETPGREGELLIKGPVVFEGYWGSTAEERSEVFDADDFFHSGDLFEIDGDDPRFLVFKGRAKDIIIRGGVNISATELDTLLEAHPKLAEAAVFGIPDEVMGERIWVAAVPEAGETITLDEIIAFLLEQEVAKFKLPERLVLMEALPRNPMNKVLRWKLKELAEAEPA
ncbi:class I adenylate-forming enzyme family protein [Oceanicaulis sp. LC35]|uniref:class I adenylate-forming enzyme family protein n=1 Tax=Oceanicaulis sp. LC35 TaxID=3349635 RepID=UPI003F87022C